MITELLHLLQLSDPALPIGSFSHSSGLETYVQKGLVTNVNEARTYITEMLTLSIHYTDAAIVSLAYDACQALEVEKIYGLDWECSAVKLASEIRLASQKLGNRLLKLYLGLREDKVLSDYGNAIRQQQAPGNYPVVFGVLSSLLKIEKSAVLTGFYYNTAAGFVTNSVKLVPLGQQQGQELLFSLQPLINKLVVASLHPDKSMIGYNCPGFDVRCMQHEGLYSRLYMS